MAWPVVGKPWLDGRAVSSGKDVLGRARVPRLFLRPMGVGRCIEAAQARFGQVCVTRIALD
jgi:hypothetical protein